MKVNSKQPSDTRIEIAVELDQSDLAAACEKAIVRLLKQVKLEGFRQGKAPRELAEKAINPRELDQETIEIAVRTTVPQAFAEVSKTPLIVPQVEVTKYVPGESAEYKATADVVPEIKLGDYKQLKAKKQVEAVKDTDIEEVIKNVQKSFAEKKVAQKAAELGDEVIIDFVGSKDGVAFPGGSAKDFPLTLGSHSFIPGFEEGIVGKASGDRFDLALTFPKDYPEKTLAGQKTNFNVLVKQVNTFDLPELNDAFAQKCSHKFKNMDDLRADIRHNLELRNEAVASDSLKNALVDELVKKSTVAAPDILVKDQLKLLESEAEQNARAAGLSLADYLKQDGLTEEKWHTELKPIAEARVKASLVLQVLAREEQISVSDQEFAAQIAQLRQAYHDSKPALENLKEAHVKNDIRNRMIIDKTLQRLVELNSR